MVIFVAPSLRDEKLGLTFIFTRMEERKCLGSDHSPGAGTIIVKGEVCLQSREKEEKLTHNHRSPASVSLFFFVQYCNRVNSGRDGSAYQEVL